MSTVVRRVIAVVGRRFPLPARGERVRVRGTAAFFLSLGLSACGITGTSPEPRFYTLASQAPPAAAASAAAYRIVVGPVTIPEVVDRPQIVTRTADNRVELDEQARWGAPLRSEISRVLADNLASLLEGSRISTTDQRASGAPDYRVLVDVQRFDSSNEGAAIQATWSVRTREGASVSGRSVLSEPGAGYEALMAAHSRALGKMAAEIAEAVKGLRR